MLTEGKLLDGVNLSISKVSQIFAHVNTSADEEEEGDEDEAALYLLYCSIISYSRVLYSTRTNTYFYFLYCTLLTYSTCYTYDSYLHHRPSFASTSSSSSSCAAATPRSRSRCATACRLRKSCSAGCKLSSCRPIASC